MWCAAAEARNWMTRAYGTPVGIISMPVGCVARVTIVPWREPSGRVVMQRRAHAERGRRAAILGRRRRRVRCAPAEAWQPMLTAYETPVITISIPEGCCARVVVVPRPELSGLDG